jgi:hypothetical protein
LKVIKKYNIIKIKRKIIMQFTYTYLKSAEMNGITVGNYKGYDVIPTTKSRLTDIESNNYIYLIYDDDNLLYHNGYVMATVDKNGNVTEFNKRRYITRREEPKSEEGKEIPRAVVPQERPAAETNSSSTTGDAVLELMVEDVLKSAREMTIDSLLDGFSYGL